MSGSFKNNSTDEFWGNLIIPFDTVIELQKIIKIFPKTRAMKTLEEFIDKVVDDHSSQVDTSTVQVFRLMKEFKLTSSTVKELSSILFGINRLNVGVVTRNQAKGKHLSSILVRGVLVDMAVPSFIFYTRLRRMMMETSVLIMMGPKFITQRSI